MSEVKSTAEACYDARMALIKERDELTQQISAYQLSQQNIINAFGISGEGAHSKLVIEYVHGLVSENRALKTAEIPCGAIENGRAFIDRLEAYPFESQGGDLKMCSDWQSLVQCFDYLAEFARGNDIQAPATDAAIAELRAQGADTVAEYHKVRVDALIDVDRKGANEHKVSYMAARDVAANLRAGRKG